MKKTKVKQTSDVPHRAFIETTGIRKNPKGFFYVSKPTGSPDFISGAIGGFHHVYGRDQGAH